MYVIKCIIAKLTTILIVLILTLYTKPAFNAILSKTFSDNKTAIPIANTSLVCFFIVKSFTFIIHSLKKFTMNTTTVIINIKSIMKQRNIILFMIFNTSKSKIITEYINISMYFPNERFNKYMEDINIDVVFFLYKYT